MEIGSRKTQFPGDLEAFSSIEHCGSHDLKGKTNHKAEIVKLTKRVDKFRNYEETQRSKSTSLSVVI